MPPVLLSIPFSLILTPQRSIKNLPNVRTALESASGSEKAARNDRTTAEEYISSSLEVDPETLMGYSRIVLVALCSERHLSIIGQKKALVQRLIRWVCHIVTL
jgi:hypothetical protein